ncbi:MAG: sugar ABC transporter permease [Caldilineaceae bacterium]|nr:sugar ABC transporter permease [Caldilineaceae bacterium]
MAAYWIVADVSVVMLLTGGTPANATHVLASWGYVTAVTGGQIGLGAAMEMTLLVVLRLLGIALGWLGCSCCCNAPTCHSAGAGVCGRCGEPAGVACMDGVDGAPALAADAAARRRGPGRVALGVGARCAC